MAKKAKQLIETIGQFQDAVLKDRADTVSVSGGSQFAHFGGLIQRCYDHYGAYPRDGALLRAIGAVAKHRGCPPYLVRRMTLEEFNSELDALFEAKGTMPVYLGSGRVRVGSEIINLEGNQEAVLEALLKRGGAATLTELRSDTLVDDVPRVLKVIRKRPGLERYIILPGGRGKGGYRTTIIDGREARHNAPQNV